MNNKILYIIICSIFLGNLNLNCMHKKGQKRKRINKEKLRIKITEPKKEFNENYESAKELLSQENHEEILAEIKDSSFKKFIEIQYFLGKLYFEGIECEKNLLLALKHCHEAAKTGDVAAIELRKEIIPEATLELLKPTEKQEDENMIKIELGGNNRDSENESESENEKNSKEELQEDLKGMYGW